MTRTELLKDSNYKLSQFRHGQIQSFEDRITVKETRGKPTASISCWVRNKEIKLTPEGAVRQRCLSVLLDYFGYPPSRIAVEYGVTFGRETKRADIGGWQTKVCTPMNPGMYWGIGKSRFALLCTPKVCLHEVALWIWR